MFKMEGETGEEVFSMLDVLEEDNELEEEANAVLGDSDDQCCTFTKVNPSATSVIIPCHVAKDSSIARQTNEHFSLG